MNESGLEDLNALPHLLSRFRIDGRLTADETTSTYRAVERLDSRRVLLREARADTGPGARAELKREAERLAMLSHPALLPLLHYEEPAGRPLLVLEYVETTLGRRLSEQPQQIDDSAHTGTSAGSPLGAEEVARMVVALAGALEYLHAHGLVHGALTPESVGFTADGQARLLSIGRAYPLRGPTPPIWRQGDPAYLAPELAQGSRPQPATDVYGLGLLVEAALDLKPATGVQMAAGQVAAWRADTPAELSAVLARALDPDPTQRWPSPSAFAGALSTALLGPAPVRGQTAPQVNMTSMLTSVISALIVIIAVLLGQRLGATGSTTYEELTDEEIAAMFLEQDETEHTFYGQHRDEIERLIRARRLVTGDNVDERPGQYSGRGVLRAVFDAPAAAITAGRGVLRGLAGQAQPTATPPRDMPTPVPK